MIAAALDHGVALERCSSAPTCRRRVRGVAARVAAAGRRRARARRRASPSRSATPRTPQAVFAVAPMPARRRSTRSTARRTRASSALALADPGNAGTLMRSAAAAGRGGNRPRAADRSTRTIPRSYGPRPARVSQSTIVEGGPRWRCSTRSVTPACAGSARSPPAGTPPERDRPHACPTAFVLGHEAHGLDPLDLPARRPRHDPDAGAAESLNVAMAGTVLLLRGGAPAPGRPSMTVADRSRPRAADAGRRRRADDRRGRRRSPSSTSRARAARASARRSTRSARRSRTSTPADRAGRRQGGRPTRRPSSTSAVDDAPRRARRAGARRSRWSHDRLDLTLGGHGYRRGPPAPRHADLARARRRVRRAWATASPRVPRSRTTGTTSRRSTSRPAIRRARCRTRST